MFFRESYLRFFLYFVLVELMYLKKSQGVFFLLLLIGGFVFLCSIHCSLAEDNESPQIIGTTQYPPSICVEPYVGVKVTAQVYDYDSGIANVLLSYSLDNGTAWKNRTMTFDSNLSIYVGEIPASPFSTLVKYRIFVYDLAGNCKIVDNLGYGYTVVPEFPSMTILVIFVLSTLMVLFVGNKLKKLGGKKENFSMKIDRYCSISGTNRSSNRTKSVIFIYN